MNKILFWGAFFVVLFTSCSVGYVDDTRFEGQWQLSSDNAYNKLVITIRRENGKLKGYIDSIPENPVLGKYLSRGQLWLSGFERKSNYAFHVIEKKPAADLFSLYNIPTSTTYKAEFINENSFGLSTTGDPQMATIIWKRLE